MDKAEISRLEELSAAGEGVILVFWHGRFQPLFALLEGQHAVVFNLSGAGPPRPTRHAPALRRRPVSCGFA